MVTTFELNNLIGRTVAAADCDPREKLVKVIGNYYRYDLAPKTVVQPDATYVIKGAVGNVLLLDQQ